MGFFRSLKSIFQEPPQESISPIPLDDLEEWLLDQKTELLRKHQLQQDLLIYQQEWTSQSDTLREMIPAWQKKLATEHEGQHLLRELRRLLERGVLPAGTSFDKAYLLSKESGIFLQELVRRGETAFASEEGLTPLQDSLLRLRAAQERFEEAVTKAGYGTFQKIKMKYRQIQELMSEVEKKEAQLGSLKERFKLAETMKSEKEAVLQTLQSQPGIQESEQRRQSLQKREEEIGDKVTISFSKLRPALLKYQEFRPGAAVVYLENPAGAFLQDQKGAVSLLGDLQTALQQGRIVLPAEQANTCYEVLDQLQKGLLRQWQEESHQMKEEPLATALNQALMLKLEDARYRLAHFSRQAEEFQERMDKLDEETRLFQEQCRRDVELLQQMIQIGLGKKVEITTGS